MCFLVTSPRSLLHPALRDIGGDVRASTGPLQMTDSTLHNTCSPVLYNKGASLENFGSTCSFSFKPSVCFSKVFFKAMGPCCKGPEASMHEGGRFASQWSTMHLGNHPMLCWWDLLVPRSVLPALLPSPARARGTAKRDGEGRKLEILKSGKKEFQWWYHTHIIWIHLGGIQKISSQNESDYLGVFSNHTVVS